MLISSYNESLKCYEERQPWPNDYKYGHNQVEPATFVLVGVDEPPPSWDPVSTPDFGG